METDYDLRPLSDIYADIDAWINALHDQIDSMDVCDRRILLKSMLTELEDAGNHVEYAMDEAKKLD